MYSYLILMTAPQGKKSRYNYSYFTKEKILLFLR